eukprot:COSAG01_NODE_2983_length_6754_cov_3.914651_8_plen_253_part_01
MAAAIGKLMNHPHWNQQGPLFRRGSPPPGPSRSRSYVDSSQIVVPEAASPVAKYIQQGMKERAKSSIHARPELVGAGPPPALAAAPEFKVDTRACARGIPTYDPAHDAYLPARLREKLLHHRAPSRDGRVKQQAGGGRATGGSEGLEVPGGWVAPPHAWSLGCASRQLVVRAHDCEQQQQQQQQRGQGGGGAGPTLRRSPNMNRRAALTAWGALRCCAEPMRALCGGGGGGGAGGCSPPQGRQGRLEAEDEGM